MNWRSLWLVISTALLFCFGLLMIFNTTSAEMIDRGIDASVHSVFQKQFLYGGLGVLFGWGAYSIGYERLIAWSSPLLIAMSVVLCALFIPGIGQAINGARRWIILFGLSFQPSESIKLLIPVYYISWYFKQSRPILFRPFLRIVCLLFVPIALILLQPDHGTTAIILCTLIVLFFLTQIRSAYWALPLFIFIGLGGFIAYQTPYVQSRISVYLHPELDLRGKGHQPHQAKIAAGSGQLFGRGLGESLQQLNYLPEARNDYIAAIYAEETGFIGILLLIGLYMSFAYAGFFIAVRSTDPA
ncbi:MAG: FtsW/RodA/SpoVE family cell cycle protein, partial [Chlamydiae bacterium]|nr:FtsW/RodA/SpoVE family cell cycle protein [Chlamydiota bacterium]